MKPNPSPPNDQPSAGPPRGLLVRFWISEPAVITLIFISTLVLFLYEFPALREQTGGVLLWIDYACVVYFLIEAILKIRVLTFQKYWASHLNKFDFFIVLFSLPVLLLPVVDSRAFSVFLVLRLGRLIRFFRVLRFIPNIEHLLAGVKRSLRASVGVFVILFILNLAFAMGATMLFGEIAPKDFGDPLIATYTLFKVFTVEGWFEIPDRLAESGVSDHLILLLRFYFIIAVMIGGILGLSLANAIFVDEMTADNTYKVEGMVQDLQQKLGELHTMLQQEQHVAWEQIRSELHQVRRAVEEMRRQG